MIGQIRPHAVFHTLPFKARFLGVVFRQSVSNRQCPLAKHLLAINLLVIFCGLSSFNLCAQPDVSEEELQAEDLPEVIRARIIDTTQIWLLPRARFKDSAKPQLIPALALYAKERRWNLPPILTPTKVSRTKPLPREKYLLRLTAYPSLPDALFYRAVFGGNLEDTRAFLHLNRKQLGNERTKGRGDYSADGIRGGLTYQYDERSELAVDAALDLKNLNWLGTEPGNNRIGKEVQHFRSNARWEHGISQRGRTAISVDLEEFRLLPTRVETKPENRATDMRLKLDLEIPVGVQNPFHFGRGVDINPIHLGAVAEYFTAANDPDADELLIRDNWSTIFRLYLRDEFTSAKWFVLGVGVEGVAYREHDSLGDDVTHLKVNPHVAITTHLGDRWAFQLKGRRNIQRAKLSELYFDADYLSLNPFLRPEKTWGGKVTLTRHQGRRFEANFSGFAKQVEDLVVLEEMSTGNGSTAPELTWLPRNRETSVQIFGGSLGITAYIANRLEAQVQYTHEVHQPEIGEQIAYRPKDFIELNVTIHLPANFHIDLGGEFRGARYTSETTDRRLERYLLLKPKISKIIENNVGLFVGGNFAIGTYTLLDGYELAQDYLDFGLELKF